MPGAARRHLVLVEPRVTPGHTKRHDTATSTLKLPHVDITARRTDNIKPPPFVGEFEPVRGDDLSQHRVLPEEYRIDPEAAETLNQSKKESGRIVAVGTTTTRTLENSLEKHGRFVAESAFAELTITPGFRFKAVNALLTNFHLPRSSLLILTSTFA